MNANEYVGGNYLNKDTLADGPKRFLITEVTVANFTGKDGGAEKKLQLLLDDDKKLSLNTINTRVLIKAFGAETSTWIGKSVIAYFDETVAFRGQPVGGVRLSIPKKKPAPVPLPVEDDETFEGDPFGNLDA